MNKNYGLTGKTVKAKFNGGDSDAYPWQGMAVPVLITGEYENFLVGEVLPHYAPHGFGLSHDPTENLEFYDAEMENCTEEYRNFVMEQLEDAKKLCNDPIVLVEQRLDFSKWVPEGFGTGDCLIVADDVLHIIDFKWGRNPGLYS